MNISDIFIIYLSCGAPFGVYYFLQNRAKLNSAILWLNSFLTAIVWFPYAFRFVNGFVTKKVINYRFVREIKSDSTRRQRIEEIEKEFSQILFEENSSFSVFDFRETMQRYGGLTFAGQIASRFNEIGENEKEIFLIANRKNIEISAKCLNRRNRQRLKFHQTIAREDFIKMFKNLKSGIKKPERIKNLALELVKILNDPEAEIALNKIFDKSLQTDSNFTVNEVENGIWKSKPNKPADASLIPLNLQSLKATATTHKPD